MPTTADLIDLDETLPSCNLQLRTFGRRTVMSGVISTIACYEDNALIKRRLSENGHGRVLVVDGGGSLRCALVGDVIAGMGADNGWAGIIVYGAVRDADLLDQMDFCVKALGTNPRKSGKTAKGSVDKPVSFGDVTFRPGEYVYSDRDGIVLAEGPLG